MGIKLVTTSGQVYNTQLNFSNIQALIKNGNLLMTDEGEYINPKNIEKILAGAPTPAMKYPNMSNFTVPTEEDNRIAQEKL